MKTNIIGCNTRLTHTHNTVYVSLSQVAAHFSSIQLVTAGVYMGPFQDSWILYSSNLFIQAHSRIIAVKHYGCENFIVVHRIIYIGVRR